MSTRLQQLFSFLESNPDDAFLIFAVAKEFEGMGQRDQAISYYKRLIEEQPNYVGTYYHLGKLYEKISDEPQAFATYERGIVAARNVNDMHALAELQNAKMELAEV